MTKNTVCSGRTDCSNLSHRNSNTAVTLDVREITQAVRLKSKQKNREKERPERKSLKLPCLAFSSYIFVAKILYSIFICIDILISKYENFLLKRQHLLE